MNALLLLCILCLVSCVLCPSSFKLSCDCFVVVASLLCSFVCVVDLFDVSTAVL